MEISRIEVPDLQDEGSYPHLESGEVQQRYAQLLARMAELGLNRLVVYGDREHSANVAYLTGGYDARFEETLLIIRPEGPPVLVIGNEGYSYSDISLLMHEKELFQTFSLQGQIRDRKRLLESVLRKYLSKSSRVGIVGLKYYEEREVRDPRHTFDIPHYIVQEIAEIVAAANLVNATEILTHPEQGLRCTVSAAELARAEFMGTYLSNQMRNVLAGLAVGLDETEVLQFFRYCGVPFNLHPTVNFGTERVLLGLASPSAGQKLQLGDPVSLSFGTAGANVARTGMAVKCRKDYQRVFGNDDIIKQFLFPYFDAIRQWYEMLRIGESTHRIYDETMRRLGNPKFGLVLNPGHQIHLEEWVNSPFREDADFRIRSGMLLQCDIMASPGKPYVGVHVEDTLAIADSSLSRELARRYPEAWQRIEKRRTFMKEVLGIRIGEELLPLSNLQAVLNPYYLDPSFAVVA